MNFEINKSYNFNTLAPTIIGNEYNNMRVKGIMDSTQAIKYRDVYTLHNNLVGVITGLPTNITDIVFVLFENQDGTDVILGLQYIDQASIIEVTSINININVRNVSSADMGIIRTSLLELGYNDLSMGTY